ncbi:hypothetical protein ACWGID_16350 [Kribbella sp. NPDC054772]
MADYSKTSMAEMVRQLAGLNASGWLQAGETWSVLATDLQTTQDNLQHAWNNTRLFHESLTFDSIANEVTASKTSVDAWRPFVERVGTQLSSIGCTIRDTQAVVGGLTGPYQDAERRLMSAMDANEGKAAQHEMDDITAIAANMMGVLSSEMQQAMGRILPVPQSKYGGPMAPSRGDQQAADDPDAKADPSAGGPQPGDAGGVPGQTPAVAPAADPASPKAPEAKDPWDEAGKVIDVISKGTDLIGKVPENLDKWVTLLQHGKDLAGGDTSTATTPDLSSVTPHGPLSDEPALAGGASTTPPTFTPTHFTPTTGGGGGGGGGLPSIGMPLGGGIGAGHTNLPTSSTGTPDRGASSLRSATTAGETGAEPSLSGKTSTGPSTGTQSASSPMYPPMNGAGAGAGAGAAARSEIRPGSAPSKSGFTVPTESTAAERLRRQGVQSDLQGRTNGERRTPSGAPPLRKRSRPARARRTGGDEVLDEELWKP